MAETTASEYETLDVPPEYSQCEPAASAVGLDLQHTCLLSIAVSLKRIADLIEGDERNAGILHMIGGIADRMPSGIGQ